MVVRLLPPVLIHSSHPNKDSCVLVTEDAELYVQHKLALENSLLTPVSSGMWEQDLMKMNYKQRGRRYGGRRMGLGLSEGDVEIYPWLFKRQDVYVIMQLQL